MFSALKEKIKIFNFFYSIKSNLLISINIMKVSFSNFGTFSKWVYWMNSVIDVSWHFNLFSPFRVYLKENPVLLGELPVDIFASK